MSNKFLRDKKNIVLAILIATVILLILIILNNKKNNNKTQTANTSNTITKVTIVPSGMKYPTAWREASSIKSTDKQAGVVSEADRANPDATAILRVVDSTLAKNFDIKTLPAETADKLKSNLSNFSLVSSNIITLGKNQALKITYKNSSSEGEQMSEQTQLIVPTANKTFYLTISGQDSEFSKMTEDINQIANNLATYIEAHQ